MRSRVNLRRTAGLGALCLALLLPFGPPASADATPIPPPTPLDAGLMQQITNEMVSLGQVPGATSEVRDLKTGEVLRLAAGKADLATGRDMRPGLDGRVGGNTMTFIATVTLQLVAEHRLGLDDSVEKYLPGKIPWGGQITIRELLNHTSGLADYLELPQFMNREQYLPQRFETFTPDQLLAFGVGMGQAVPVGTWNFSYTNYIAMGMILEKVTHESVQDLVTDRIIRPLHLKDTYFPYTRTTIPFPHADGYFWLADKQQWVDVTDENPSLAWAARGIISNVPDLMKFYEALFVHGTLLRPAQVNEMLGFIPVYKPGPGGPPISVAQGLGIVKVTWPCGVSSYGTFGSWMYGYDSVVHISEDRTRLVGGMVNEYIDDVAQGPVLVPTLVAGFCSIHTTAK